jgi:hypothetical protein
MSVTTARIRNRGTDATARIPRNRHILSAMLSLPKVRRGPILGDGPAVSNERSSDGLRDRTIVSSSTSEGTTGLATEPSSIPDDSGRDARRSTDATQYPTSHASARGSSGASRSTRGIQVCRISLPDRNLSSCWFTDRRSCRIGDPPLHDVPHLRGAFVPARGRVTRCRDERHLRELRQAAVE